MYYSAIGFLAVLILLIENHEILLRRNIAIEVPSWKVYRRFLFAVLVYYITDVLWGLLESRKLAFLLFADTTVYFAAMAVGVLFWVQYTIAYLDEKDGFARFLTVAGCSIAGLIILITIVNIFRPVLFTVDGDCVYHALPLRYVMLAGQILLLLLISLYAVLPILQHRTEKAYRCRALASFGLIMAVFLFVQLWFPYLPLYSIAYMLGTCLLHTFVVIDEKEEYRHNEEQIAYARLNALTGDFLCVYVVEPETGRYREFSAAAGYETLVQAKAGMDFFATTREAARKLNHPEDLNRFLMMFTRENIMEEIGKHGIFTLSYRIMMEDKPLHVQLKAAMVEEKEGRRLIVGINDIDAQVRQEEEYAAHLAKARIEANIDALTGVKNRHAYLLAEERLNLQIEENSATKFAIVILDVNDLKKINDTAGHKAGDQFLRDACRIICNIFDHSPVFRIGGDEFAVIAQGSDYACIEELIGRVKDHNREALHTGGIVIACGMAKREGKDANVASVFERADQNMYGNKNGLKAENKG